MSSEIPSPEQNNTENMNLLSRILRIMSKRKELDGHDQHKPGKIWSYLDLISIGIITSLGFGVFALHGHIASEMSGPSTLVSYAIVTIIGLIVVQCYIEFTYRIPVKAGSSYNFISTVLCEIIRFIIGWNLILEYIIAAACASRSFSQHLDTLLDNTLAESFADIVPMKADGFAGYFDFLAFALPITIAIAIALGLKRYRIQTTVITVINLIFLWFILIAGIVRARTANWKIAETIGADNQPDPTIGEGGFMPFTITGTMQAASICIIVFIGFDSLTNTFNRETIQQSRRKVPLTFLLSFGLIAAMYISISTTLTLMFPYHRQSANAWIPYAFVSFGWDYAKYLGAIGGMICLGTSLYLFLYSIIPLVKQMAYDGLIFETLGAIKTRPFTPVLGILSSGVLTGMLSGLFETRQLLNALSLGTLLLFLGITVSIIILRYSCSSNKQNATFGRVLLQLCNAKCKSVPSSLTAKIVAYFVVLYCIASLGLSLTLAISHQDVFSGEIWAVVLASLFLALMLLFILGIAVQPKEQHKDDGFKVPLVPVLPGLAIFMIIYLITRLHYANWIRFGIWMIVGVVIYFWGMYNRDRGVKNKSVMMTPNTSSKELKLKENGTNGTVKVETIKLEKPTAPEKREEVKVASAPEVVVKPSPELRKPEVVVQKVVATKSTEDINSLHSSTKSYDEIQSIDEVQDNLKEKKQPNGNVYYVENEKEEMSESSGKSSPKQDTETRFALAFLDDIIQDEEKRPPSVNFEEILSSPEISTEAVIHREGSVKNEPVVSEELPQTFYIPPPPPLPPPIKRQDSDSDDSSEEGAQKRAFKKRLTVLYAEKSNGQTKPIKKPDDERPVLQHSHSESDLQNMVEHESNLNHDASRSNPALALELGVVNIPDPPKFDPALFAEIGKRFDKPVKPDPESPIPEAPIFDPVLYKSLGRKPKKMVVLEAEEPKAPSPKFEKAETPKTDSKVRRYSPKVQPQPLSVAPEPTPTDDDTYNRQTIKQKLELIFQRGPPIKAPLAKPKPELKPVEEPPPQQNHNHKDGHNSDDDDDEMNDIDTSMISDKKPFDTVKLQRIRFDNVLKLIKDETKPSIIRNNSLQRSSSNRSTLSSDIHANDLHHGPPLKKFLPDT